MGHGSFDRLAAVSLGAHVAGVEIGLVTFAVAVVVVLYVLKFKRSHDQRLRKAASVGYHDFDVARYGGTAPGQSLIESTVADSGPQTLAPSFSAPPKGSRRKDRTPADSRPDPTQVGALPPSLAPPRFDPADAERRRSQSASVTPPSPNLPPPPGAPLLPPPPGAPGAAGGEEPEAGDSGLPLLAPLPPPPCSPPPPGR